MLKLTAADAKRAEESDKAGEAALKADRWDDAIARAEELLALRTKALGPKHFETVDAEWRVKTLRLLAPLSKEDRAAFVSADGMNAQGEALYAGGKYAAAKPLYENALEIRRRLLTDEHPLTAGIYNNLALNFDGQGQHATAKPMFEKAIELLRRALSDDHPETASAYNNLALNLNAQGQYAAAQPLFEKALVIHHRLLSESDPKTALSYNNLALNLKFQGQYAAAQPLYEKALDLHRRLLTDNHPQTALIYNNLAMNLSAQGQYAAAQPVSEKALELFRRLLTENHPNTALCYGNVALNLFAQGQFAAAQPLLEKALEIERRLLSDNHPLTAKGYDNLAANLNAQGKYAAARPLAEKSLEIHLRLFTDDHPDTATAYNNLALNLGAQGQYVAAQRLHEKALEIRRRRLTDDHPKTAVTFSSVAANLSAQGKYQQARDLGLAAVKSQDAARLQAAFTGLDRVETRASARPALAALLARLGQPADAWQTLEEDLGRGLLDELAARQDRRLVPGDRVRLHDLVTALERLDKLAETNPKGLDQAQRAKRFSDLKSQRALASTALGEFQTKLVKNYGPLAGQVATLKEVQAALPADAALVAWVDIPPTGPNAADPDGEHWGVVVRSRGIPSWVAIGGTGPHGLWTKDDGEFGSRLRTQLRARPGSGAADLRPLIEGLRAQRLEPLAKSLGGAPDGQPPVRRIIVLPSRAMAGIPVELLLAQNDVRTVSYAPSATVFKYLREQPCAGRHAGVLALGDSIYERSDKSSEAHPAPDHGLVLKEGYAPLPGTRYEVEAISQLFQSDDRPAVALLGRDASEPELDRLAASGELARLGYIHLAAHGVIDEAIPQRSAVILTQTGLPDPLEQVLNHRPAFDGRLSVREIQRTWDLKAELVTLSACETALGRESGGEGFVGFTQALLMSGARSVCLSLWKVDDTATALLMQRFYASLLGRRPGLSQPLPKAEALAEAKAWLRGLSRDDAAESAASLAGAEARSKGAAKRKEAPFTPSVPGAAGSEHPYAHPYYWAAFVLVGDPD
jgi:CHAT domain-containing protein/tetratricopeptide (TPR) repeat protein